MQVETTGEGERRERETGRKQNDSTHRFEHNGHTCSREWKRLKYWRLRLDMHGSLSLARALSPPPPLLSHFFRKERLLTARAW